ncbi:MAG: hypothetical protein A2Y48_01985 [Nitrospirae bacterium RIFCSPLOW2_12_42_9]|nr:MAG: hypothetical protein A2035_06405 [Nitrospirae bacterium GWA2_42_11]OGW60399.1 MAG: hypothetical protein A2Y48_01985 [Nitrospirae bacterium RIFCSPLOW2_12_42_9]HAS17467.1 hypothetical protein [Nitrospiraceae bacterium]HBI24680.1 hypothetical protein [Nitrospiraceae bacterium]
MDYVSTESLTNPERVYDGLASVYDHWVEEVPALKIFYSIFNKTIEQNKDKFHGTVLDLGCGTGILSKRISTMENVKKVIGIDISPLSIGQASGKEIPGCNFSVGSATRIPLKNKTVEAVVAYGDILSHIHEDYSSAISEIARVCKPGGYIFFDIDNKWNLSLFYEWEELSTAINSSISEGHVRIWSFIDSTGKFNTMKFKTFTPGEIKRLLISYGLELISFEGIIIFPNLLPQNIHYDPSGRGFLSHAVMALSKVDSLISRLPGLRGFGIGASIIARRL